VNPLYVSKDGPAEEMRGVAVDLARDLSERLGVPFEPVRYNSIKEMMDKAKSGEWDVAFVGYDPARASDMDFAAAYLEVGNSYLVAQDSPVRSIGDADKPGHRIGVAARSILDIFLTGHLKQAQLIRASAVRAEGVQLLSSGAIDALAGDWQMLLDLSAKVLGSRVVEGSVYGNFQALAVAKGRPAGLAYAKEFIEAARASGSVEQAIQRAGLRGVTVAPPESAK
jgi:polar amino acid transport system substrate-binding protein